MRSMHVLNLASLLIAATVSHIQGGQKPRALINPALYPIFQRYTLFSVAADTIGPGEPCANPPFHAAIIQTFNITSTDTQATIFRDDAAREFIVAFPGTADQHDWQNTDLNQSQTPYISPGVYCPGCHAHLGFLGAWNSIEGPIRDALTPYLSLNEYKAYTVTPTGHSLGGALALMCYVSLKGLKFPIKWVYTFGQPRIVDQKGANYIDALSGAGENVIGEVRRVTHTDDGVPQHPPLSLGYIHSGTEFYELDTPNWNQSAATTWRCFGQEAMDCDRGAAKGQFINAAHGQYTGVTFAAGEGCV